jgi:hypothetical protein
LAGVTEGMISTCREPTFGLSSRAFPATSALLIAKLPYCLAAKLPGRLVALPRYLPFVINTGNPLFFNSNCPPNPGCNMTRFRGMFIISMFEVNFNLSLKTTHRTIVRQSPFGKIFV